MSPSPCPWPCLFCFLSPYHRAVRSSCHTRTATDDVRRERHRRPHRRETRMRVCVEKMNLISTHFIVVVFFLITSHSRTGLCHSTSLLPPSGCTVGSYRFDLIIITEIISWIRLHSRATAAREMRARPFSRIL